MSTTRRGPVWTPNFRAPLGTPTSDIFIDESGSKATQSRFFVLGLVKVRDSALLLRDLADVRARTKFSAEFKFSQITRSSLPAYFEACELLGSADIRIGGYVFNKDENDPFIGRRATWQVQADCIARLVRGNTNRGELLSVHLDAVTTPRGISIAKEVQDSVNSTLNCTTVVSSLDLDSKSTELLQMADLVAGAISYERRIWSGEHPEDPQTITPKGQVMRRLQRCLGLDSFDDVQEGKANIKTAPPSLDRSIA